MWQLMIGFLFVCGLANAQGFLATDVPAQRMQVAKQTVQAQPIMPIPQPLPVAPPSDPSKLQVLVWANEAAVAAFQFDYLNARHFVQMSSQYFSSTGWQSYMTPRRKFALQDAVAQREVRGAVAIGAPLVVNQEAMAWTVQVPLLVTHMNLQRKSEERVMVTMHIVKASEGLRGLAIQTFDVGPMPAIPGGKNH